MTGLLEAYAPRLRYDLLERDELGSVDRVDGQLVRESGPPCVPFAAGYLGGDIYGDGSRVRRGDYLALRARESGPGVVYGHAVEQAGAVWLGYWLWYAYNGFHWSLNGWHWGDWEYVTVRVPLDAATPDIAVYAQHRTAEARPWAHVRQDDGHPVVFAALGSHASRFERSALATGARSSGRLALEELSADAHPWLEWPGRWGQSRAGGRWADSPRGPRFHRQWADPAGWARDAVDEDGLSAVGHE